MIQRQREFSRTLGKVFLPSVKLAHQCSFAHVWSLAVEFNIKINFRCRIGHSRLTHSYLLKGEPLPQCVFCACPLTVHHVLLECVDFDLIRQQYFSVRTMDELFHHVSADTLLKYLKATNLYKLLWLLMLYILTCCWIVGFNYAGFRRTLGFINFLVQLLRYSMLLTCSRREYDPGCRHGVKPSLTHSLCLKPDPHISNL